MHATQRSYTSLSLTRSLLPISVSQPQCVFHSKLMHFLFPPLLLPVLVPPRVLNLEWWCEWEWEWGPREKGCWPVLHTSACAICIQALSVISSLRLTPYRNLPQSVNALLTEVDSNSDYHNTSIVTTTPNTRQFIVHAHSTCRPQIVWTSGVQLFIYSRRPHNAKHLCFRTQHSYKMFIKHLKVTSFTFLLKF